MLTGLRMQAIIGSRLLRQLKPLEKPFEVRDQRTKGFLLRVQPSGTMTYLAQYGRGRRVSLGKVGVITPTDAREMAKKILGNAMMGNDPSTIQRDTTALTLTKFLEEEYELWASAHLKSAKSTLARIKSSFADFLDIEINQIDPLAITRWRTRKLNSGSQPTTVNRDLACLKSALSKAVEWGLIDRHPLSKVKSIRIDQNKEPRYLTKEEFRKLIDALDKRELQIRNKRMNGNIWRADRHVPLLPDLKEVTFADYLKPMILLSLNTGLRRGELFNLDWKDINFEQRLLTVRGGQAKSGKTRHLPLNRSALNVLTSWKQQNLNNKGFIFVGKNGGRFDNVNKSWRELLRQANIKSFRWHDLRHTFASWLVMQSVDLNTVRELLGHADLKMTLRYAHLAPEHKAKAIGKLKFGV
jgi:integrase